jgi:hypothetical protein
MMLFWKDSISNRSRGGSLRIEGLVVGTQIFSMLEWDDQ